MRENAARGSAVEPSARARSEKAEPFDDQVPERAQGDRARDDRGPRSPDHLHTRQMERARDGRAPRENGRSVARAVHEEDGEKQIQNVRQEEHRHRRLARPERALDGRHLEQEEDRKAPARGSTRRYRVPSSATCPLAPTTSCMMKPAPPSPSAPKSTDQRATMIIDCQATCRADSRSPRPSYCATSAAVAVEIP